MTEVRGNTLISPHAHGYRTGGGRRFARRVRACLLFALGALLLAALPALSGEEATQQQDGPLHIDRLFFVQERRDLDREVRAPSGR